MDANEILITISIHHFVTIVKYKLYYNILILSSHKIVFKAIEKVGDCLVQSPPTLTERMCQIKALVGLFRSFSIIPLLILLVSVVFDQLNVLWQHGISFQARSENIPLGLLVVFHKVAQAINPVLSRGKG